MTSLKQSSPQSPFPQLLQQVFPRAIPPAPGMPAVRAILRAREASLQQGSAREGLKAVLRQLYPGRTPFLYRSGTAALYACFTALKKDTSRQIVALSAYTCPDIAAAAVRAGFRVALIDVLSDRVAMNPSSVPCNWEQCAAVVLSNLYGAPEEIEPWSALAEEYGFIVVDDACQAALSKNGLERVGGRADTVGVVSFGRGKALSAAGGGALLIPARSELLEQCAEPGEQPGGAGQVRDLLYGLSMSLFAKPQMYWLPSSMSFLGLGETVYHPEFPTAARSGVAWLFALARALEIEELARSFEHEARRWAGTFTENALPDISARGTVLIRYPLLCKSESGKRSLTETSAARRVGISGSYPKTLEEFSALQPHLVYKDVFAAKDISRRLITLPVHADVSESDRRRIAELVAGLMAVNRQ